MPSDLSLTSSETIAIIGAGATAALGMPTTDRQSHIFRDLSAKDADIRAVLAEHFAGRDLEIMECFLAFLDGNGGSIHEVTKDDVIHARAVYGAGKDDKTLSHRIRELRARYDWGAAKRVIAACPHNKRNDSLIRDAYSIIDRKLLAHQSLEAEDGSSLSATRLEGARNFLTLFINLLFASAWNRIAEGGKSETFERYKRFIRSFGTLMQKEGRRFCGKHPLQDRAFYLFSTSFVSFNFELVFPWIFMNVHRELNKGGTYIGDRPLKLWLDYGCEHRRRKVSDGTVVSALEFTEAVASRENEDGDAHVGSELNRCGKFYFAHGSSAWRECPVCARMTFLDGSTVGGWNYLSRGLFPAFPIPIFERGAMTLTKQEKAWSEGLALDALQCMHCGARTETTDAPMIMQTMHKATPTSFLEEIQRAVRISLAKARHIVLLGYRLPEDDTIWQQALSEAVRGRCNTENAAYCSVVAGIKGGCEWLCDDGLDRYVAAHRNKDDASEWGVPAIENAIAIFGKEHVRAWTGGIPQVFGTCDENAVNALFYPQWVEWHGTRLET